MQNTELKNFRCGYAAILGRPNAGKSTLLNRLLDFKLSITSPRPQTTRRNVLGILNRENLQAVFLDTPGILEPRYNLQKSMMKAVSQAVADADVILYIVEMQKNYLKQRQNIIDFEIFKKLEFKGKNVLLVLNKIDLTGKEELLPVIDFFAKSYDFSAIVPVSALKKDGMEALLKELQNLLPLHPPFYDREAISEQPEKFFVAELIREQIFYVFQQEIPYSTEVMVEEFVERKKQKDLIRAVIFVERESQKGILIGKQGEALKQIGSKARYSIEKFLQRPVYLDLVVKTRKDWRRDDNELRKFGY